MRGGANRLGIIQGGHNRLGRGAGLDQGFELRSNVDCCAVGLGRDGDIGRSINHGGGFALWSDSYLSWILNTVKPLCHHTAISYHHDFVLQRTARVVGKDTWYAGPQKFEDCATRF